MNYQQMKKHYDDLYNNSAYADSSEQACLFALLAAAAHLSPAAQLEFAQAFSFDFAIDGEIYLGGRRTAAHKYPNLIAEAPAAGISLVIR